MERAPTDQKPPIHPMYQPGGTRFLPCGRRGVEGNTRLKARNANGNHARISGFSSARAWKRRGSAKCEPFLKTFYGGGGAAGPAGCCGESPLGLSERGGRRAVVPMNSILDRRSILTLSDADGYHPLIYACAVPRPYDDPHRPPGRPLLPFDSKK